MRISFPSRLRNSVCAIALLCATTASSATPGDEGSLEWKVKAAFLVNFARFTEWPADKFATADTPIVFCVRDNEMLADALNEALEGKAIKGRALALRRESRPEEMRLCHVAYLGGSAVDRVAAALSTLAGSSALSIYEGDEHISGGAIRLFPEDRKVRFEVELKVITREHLSMSSRLLSLAKVVQR